MFQIAEVNENQPDQIRDKYWQEDCPIPSEIQKMSKNKRLNKLLQAF
jgi:hypothetical protein